MFKRFWRSEAGNYGMIAAITTVPLLAAVAGALIGRATEPGRCYYRDRRGRRVIANCPAGY